MVRTDVTPDGDAIVDVAIQPDGKIVAAGEAGQDFGVVRYTSTGALDASFGTGGLATIDFGGNDNPWAVALQADGKIVVAGGSDDRGDVLLARLDADGSLDTTFGTGGRVISDLGGSETANGVAIQTDGRIVIAGNRFVDGQRNDFIVARYTAGGSLDATFGGDGVVTTDFSAPDDYGVADDVGESMALQADGRIVVAGTSNRQLGEFDNVRDFALARYLSDGSLDTTFDGDGTVLTNVGQFGGVVTETFDYAWAVTIQPDGRIVAAGQTENNWKGSFGLVRYALDGTLDPSFGGDGRVVTTFGEGAFARSSSAFDVAIQADGKVVAAGHVENSTDDFALVRYDGAGNLDPTFDLDGRVETDFGPDISNNYRDSAYALAIQPDGRIVAAGSSASAFALARYLPGGAAVLPQCADGGDNDGDGLTDYPADPGCESATDDSEAPDPATQCADGFDNDADGLVDYPADPGCESAADDSESPDPTPTMQCDDGVDNDKDGFIDYPADPGCESVKDDSEAPDPGPVAQCADGLDNDGDKQIDYPADPGCESATDDSESPDPVLAQCADGLDNDGDGRIDYPADRNCESATDDSESRVRPPAQCSDGLDNDGDGLADYPADPGCRSATDKSERNRSERPAATSTHSESDVGWRIK